MKGLFVTGMYRGGTTWVGECLSYSPTAYYLGEPMAKWNYPYFAAGNLIHHYMHYVTKDEWVKGGAELEHALRLKFDHKDIWRHLRNKSTLRTKLAVFKRYYEYLTYQDQLTPIIKDPIAFFNTLNLVDRLDLGALIVVRHPVPVVLSCMRMGWKPVFSDTLLIQEQLMEKYLEPFKGQMLEADKKEDIVYTNALMWFIFFSVAKKYFIDHPNVHDVINEDLSLKPVEVYHALYQLFGLEWTPEVEQRIRDKTTGSEQEKPAKQIHYKSRDSKLLAYEWMNRVDPEVYKQVEGVCRSIASEWYGKDYWL